MVQKPGVRYLQNGSIGMLRPCFLLKDWCNRLITTIEYAEL